MRRKPFCWKSLIVGGLLFFIFTYFVAAEAFGQTKFKLTFVSFVPLSNRVEYQFFKANFIDKVNKKAKGRLVIDVKGGPEVIRPFDLGVSVQKGIIDMATIPLAFFDSLIPAASIIHLSDYTAIEERQNGIYNEVQKIFERAGLFYLGRGEATEKGYFVMFLRKKAERPADFGQLKLGGSTSFHGWYKRLGATAVTLAIPEYNTALERGVVDGLVTSPYVAFQYGLHEVSKYMILPGAYRSTVVVPVNLHKWNSLPKDLQQLLLYMMVEFEKKYSEFELAERKKTYESMEKKASLRIIQLKAKIAQWYLKAAEEGAMAYVKSRFPKHVEEIMYIKKLITKR